jgi:hypothetical protein
MEEARVVRPSEFPQYVDAPLGSLAVAARREKIVQQFEVGCNGLDQDGGLASGFLEHDLVTLADLYGHSHQIQRYKWIWIRKGVLSKDSIGFPASTAEIRRFWGRRDP